MSKAHRDRLAELNSYPQLDENQRKERDGIQEYLDTLSEPEVSPKSKPKQRRGRRSKKA